MARKYSYSYDVKAELIHIFCDDEKLSYAELISMLSSNSQNFQGRLEFFSVHFDIVQRLISLAKKVFPDAKVEISAVRTKYRFKKMKYAVKIFLTRQTEILFQDFLSDTYFKKILDRPAYGVAYLRGAFLTRGSVNRPEKPCHFEISCQTRAAAEFLKKVLKIFDMHSNVFERKGEFVVYVKNGDSICDLLAILGAEKSAERFEIARNIKEVRSMVNRIVNCDTANVSKTARAVQKNLADIKLILASKVEVQDFIKLTMDFRMMYPEDSLRELAKKMNLSHQGLASRLKKIHEIAEKVRQSRANIVPASKKP